MRSWKLGQACRSVDDCSTYKIRSSRQNFLTQCYDYSRFLPRPRAILKPIPLRGLDQQQDLSCECTVPHGHLLKNGHHPVDLPVIINES